MKPWFLIVAAAVVVGPMKLNGQPARELQDFDPLEIEKTFSRYNQGLIEKNYEEVALYLRTPFVVIDNTPRIITDLSTVVTGLRTNRESLDQRGYGTSVPGEARISVLNPDRVLLNCVIRHYKKDGSLLEERANFYLMSRVSGTWKISGILQQDPAYAGKSY